MIAAPKTRQSLLSGEHKMFDAGKSAGPNCRERKVTSAPKTPQGLLSGKHEMFDAGKSAGPNCRGAK